MNIKGLTLLFLLLFYSIAAGAIVYKYTDENGILFFTDNPDNIPEGQRHTAEKIETDERLFTRWINQTASKVALLLVLLIAIISLAGRFFGYLFPRILLRLLVILFLGAMIYSISVVWKGGSASRFFDKTVEPYLPSPAPINRAKEQVKKLEESQKKQEEMIDSLKDSERQ